MFIVLKEVSGGRTFYCLTGYELGVAENSSCRTSGRFMPSSCRMKAGISEIVQQPGQVLVFLLPKDTLGMVVSAPGPPQTEEPESETTIILVAPV